MTKDTCHSFDTCPLRSSSLLIVHHDQQLILTASDDAYDILGRRDDQLINQPLALLSLSTLHSHQARRQVTRTRHAITQEWIQLELCVHHDPFSTASGLDYCLFRAISNDSQQKNQQQQQHQSMANVTLLGLNAYGSIMHAYPSSQFPHPSSRDMVGRPIMSFIHTDDVRPLCRLLRKSTTHPHLPTSTKDDYTMDIRWLNPANRLGLDATPEFEWMQITIVNPTIYNHVPALNGRPICLLRPSNSSSSSSTCFGVLGSLMAALENGRIYCMEFLNHLLVCVIQILHDLATISQQPLSSSTTQLSSLPSSQQIKVMDGTSIRLIPLSSPPFLSNSSSDSLFYLLSSTFFSYTMPTSFLPDRSLLLELLKPIFPQTNSPSSPL